MTARALLAYAHYQPPQDLIKKDAHGFSHDCWERSFQKHLCLQSEIKQQFG